MQSEWATLPVPGALFDEEVLGEIQRIKAYSRELFQGKLNKVPSEILTNELTNSFLHTHIAPIFLRFYPEVRAKNDINQIINQSIDYGSESPQYIRRWDSYLTQISKFGLEEEFYARMREKILQPIGQNQESAKIKIKLLSLMSYIRLRVGIARLKKPQEIWKFLYGEKFPTDSLLGTEKARKDFKKSGSSSPKPQSSALLSKKSIRKAHSAAKKSEKRTPKSEAPDPARKLPVADEADPPAEKPQALDNLRFVWNCSQCAEDCLSAGNQQKKPSSDFQDNACTENYEIHYFFTPEQQLDQKRTQEPDEQLPEFNQPDEEYLS